MTRMSTSTKEEIDTLSEDKVELLRLLVERKGRRTQKISPHPRSDGTRAGRLPTSWAQQRLWFIDQMEGGSAAYNFTLALSLRGVLDQKLLRQSLDALVLRHEVLRTTFVSAEGSLCQEIKSEGHFELKLVDLTRCEEGVREAQIQLQKAEESKGLFDLRVGPLVRGRLVRVRDEQHLLLVTIHHIVSDGWSMGIFLRELSELFRAFQEGRSDPLDPLPLQYADYAQWQRQWFQGEVLERQLSYWRARLAGAAPQLDLPTDRPRPEVQSYRGGSIRVVLDAQLCAKLKSLAKENELTLFMVLYAGWALLLSRLSGQDDVVIGTPIANRQRPEVEGLIGFFANTLALRIGVGRGLRVEELLASAKEVTLGAYGHQDVPFDKVVEALQPARSLGRNPIFQVMLALQNAPGGELHLPGLEVTLEEGVDEVSAFDLFLSLEERGGEIVGSASYVTDLFDRETIERWMACFNVILREIADGTRRCVGDLSILPESERLRIRESFNEPSEAYPHDGLVHELFEEQVRRTPNAVALSFHEHQLTYSELNDRANRLARYLLCEGIGSDKLVALCVERGVEMVVGLLGILKAGGAYVPIDATYPYERLAYMLQDSAPRLLLTQSRLIESLPETAAKIIALDRDWNEIEQQPPGNLDAFALGQHSNQLAYVIYTSGSTGKPKGVMVEHAGVVNFLTSMRRHPGIGPTDCMLAVTTLSFDIAGLEIFLPLVNGAKVVLASRDASSDAHLLMAMMEDCGITVLQATPVTWQLLLSAGWNGRENLKALCGGEALSTDLSRELVMRVGALWNLYGPTETTIWSCARQISTVPDASETVESIGRPIANTHIYILDSQQHPVPIGVVGEIYIGGAGVSRGYLNRPQLTAERFSPDPFNADPKARVYKTGDLGRWRSDGTIHYRGRNDQQVKIRGHRIELGEIEAQLTRHKLVRSAVVLAREDAPGEKRLVAYLVHRENSGPGVDELRSHLKAVLPEYMVPSAYVVLDSLPLTPNGKVDRRALPAPELGAYASRRFEAPQGELEMILASIWQDLLSVERVGRQDNFFDLGGHSLLIARMLEQLRRVGLSTEVRRVFDKPTLAALALTLTGDAAEDLKVPPNLIPPGCTEITPHMLPLVNLKLEEIERIVQAVPGGAGNIKDIYPLAPLQEGILFHHQLSEQRGDTYVLPILLELPSRERLKEFIGALQEVIDRHDVLRTAVLSEQLSQPVQVVYRTAKLPVEEVALDLDRDPIEQLKERMRFEHQRLDLGKAPLMRLQVSADTGGSQLALLQTHHLACDNESLEIMLAEIIALLEGRREELPRPLPYRNHVAQALARARKPDSEAFFRSRLGEINEPTAPFGLLDVRGDGSRIVVARQTVDSALSTRIRVQARRLSLSAATLFHAAWALVVACTSARDDVVYGTVLLGRFQGSADAQRTLGMFINTLPLRIRLHGVTALQLVQQTQRELVELLSHEQASLAVAQRCSGISGSAPLFSALLNYRRSGVDPSSKCGAAADVKLIASQSWTNYPVMLSITDSGDGFELIADTDRRIDPCRVTEYMKTAMRSLVEALERAPQRPALSLTIMPDGELRQVTDLFNRTKAPYSRQLLIHELFEQQVERTPTATAAEHRGRSISYAALNGLANQLARQLVTQGVGPDQLVGICVERGIEMVLGLLGILKAGGAYLPLDPNYPPERLRYMLEDAGPRVVLTQEELRMTLSAAGAKMIALDTFMKEITEDGIENVPAAERGLTAKNLVYVIYTSGSTGRPKGTAMAHQSMVNLIEWHRESFGPNIGQRALQFAALSFDVAFQEIFSTLCTGGTLVLLDEWVRRDARALAEFLSIHSIERLFVPPLVLQALAECCQGPNAVPRDLKNIITAGEQLRVSPQVVNLFKRLPRCRLHNHYGPTETHVVTALTLMGDPERWPSLPPIGRPISNAQIYVMDALGRPVPIGVSGEVYIGGVGVAHGYLRKPGLTAQRFIADPFSTEPDARLYKTGDLGRWREDGSLEYLGRSDDQVKLRGYRIELGEIEAQLAFHQGVKEVVVVAREDVPGEKRLVAYVTGLENNASVVQQLRAHVKGLLPDYMVPGAFVVLERMPLTPNGKLDRRGLPPPELDAYWSRQYEAPQGEVEQILAEIWRELLGVPRVGRQDNFFELGGHSLHAMKLNAKITDRLMTGIAASAVFKHPTVREIAELVKYQRLVDGSSVEPQGIEFEEGVI